MISALLVGPQPNSSAADSAILCSSNWLFLRMDANWFQLQSRKDKANQKQKVIALTTQARGGSVVGHLPGGPEAWASVRMVILEWHNHLATLNSHTLGPKIYESVQEHISRLKVIRCVSLF